MSDTKITMSDVSRRRFLLESTKSNPASITNATLKHLQRNLTYERLLYFLEAVSKSGADCNRFFIESINMINQLDASDIQKQPLIVQLTDNIMPKVSPDNIRNLNSKKAHGGIPMSDIINKKVNDTIIMDRIIKNNDALSKRFDIDKIFIRRVKFFTPVYRVTTPPYDRKYFGKIFQEFCPDFELPKNKIFKFEEVN